MSYIYTVGKWWIIILVGFYWARPPWSPTWALNTVMPVTAWSPVLRLVLIPSVRCYSPGRQYIYKTHTLHVIKRLVLPQIFIPCHLQNIQLKTLSLFRISLHSRKNHGSSFSSTVYSAPGAPDTLVRSWKMNERKYYDIPSPFPTLARGIFTTDVDELPSSENLGAKAEGEGKYRIVARGYDKFFNIGEVPWTTV